MKEKQRQPRASDIRLLRSADVESPTGGGLRILYVPAFGEPAELADQQCRMAWHFHPVVDRIARITFVTNAEAPAGVEIPPYLDPEIARLLPRLEGKVVHDRGDDETAWRRRIDAADILMIWQRLEELRPDCARLLNDAMPRKQWYRIDRRRDPLEGALYLRALASNDPDLPGRIEESRERFRIAVTGIGRCERVYVFGTGPSLQRALEMDFSDGVTIACNSMVKNRRLMDHLRPRLVTMADPVFHAGPSTYAGAFRRHLFAFLDDCDALAIVPERDYPVYLRNCPARFRDRFVGVPCVKRDSPNLDLLKEFAVARTSNILTLFLLPLAATIATEGIAVIGCDGRPLHDDGYFWNHHRASQIGGEMSRIREAHPSFFDIDYNAYYTEHLRTVDRWVRAAAHQGLTVSSLTPSHIPALGCCAAV